MRSREDPEELARARAAVAAWRDQNPAGTAGQLVAALGGGFHPDYGPVLRGMLFAIDRDRATARRVGKPRWTGESEPSRAACLD